MLNTNQGTDTFSWNTQAYEGETPKQYTRPLTESEQKCGYVDCWNHEGCNGEVRALVGFSFSHQPENDSNIYRLNYSFDGRPRMHEDIRIKQVGDMYRFFNDTEKEVVLNCKNSASHMKALVNCEKASTVTFFYYDLFADHTHRIEPNYLR